MFGDVVNRMPDSATHQIITQIQQDHGLIGRTERGVQERRERHEAMVAYLADRQREANRAQIAEDD